MSIISYCLDKEISISGDLKRQDVSFIDVVSKKITGWYLGKTCSLGDLVFNLNQAIKNETLDADHMLTIRSDNGP